MRIGAKARLIFSVAIMLIAPVWAIGGSNNAEVKTGMNTTFNVGLMVSGRLDVLGTITFDNDNNGVLSLQSDGAEAVRLQEAWNEVADQKMLHVRRTKRVKEDDGSTLVKFIGVNVERTSEGFPLAAIEYLSNKYGFFGAPAR